MKPAKRALIIVDMQNSFARPDGSLYVKGAETLVPGINKAVSAARTRGEPTIFTQDWHPANHCSFKDNGGIWPTHCVQNTDGAKLVQGLTGTLHGTPLHKGTDVGVDSYSAFYDNDQAKSTGLTNFLRGEGVTHVDVVGVALDYCVKFTALDAVKDGFKVRLFTDLTKAVNIHPLDGENALKELQNKGVEVTTFNKTPELDR